MSERKSRKPRWRSVSMLMLGLLLGTIMLTPVSAHLTNNVGHNWRKHYRPLADKRYADNKLSYQRTVQIPIANNGIAIAEAVCPPNWYATGGGMAPGTFLFEMGGWPSDGTGAFAAGRSGWTVIVGDLLGAGPSVFRAYVVCAKVDKTPGNYTNGMAPIAPNIELPDGLELPEGVELPDFVTR